jgi:hypothetical protein
MPKTVCSVRYTTLPVRIPPVPLRLLVTLRAQSDLMFVEIFGKYIADGCTIRLWPKIAMLLLVSFEME